MNRKPPAGNDMMIVGVEPDLCIDDYVGLLAAAGYATGRPIVDLDRVWTMLANSNLIVTARIDGQLIGAARAMTDFSFCCYIADLVVAQHCRGRNVGRALIAEVRRQAGPEASCLLIAWPDHEGYYEHIGMTRIENAYYFERRYG